MRRSVLWVVASLAMLPVPAVAAALKPVSVEQFFVTPEQPALLQWKVEGEGKLREPLPYTVYPYSPAGEPVSLGLAAVTADRVTATVKLAQGFYEIEFPPTKQRFGVVALPACKDPPDPFFAIDGALSWLVRDDATREGLVRAARRSGIGMIRERLTWGAVHPAADRWDWQGPVRFDSLRQACRAHGVEVLEMAHDAPAWMGRVAKYPDDLVAASRSWQEIARRWKPAWGAVEIWNEPDIFFGGDLPADQYTALVRALAYGLRNPRDPKPIVGGVVAHHNREFLETAAENGLLECADAFSFHTYGRATEMQPLVERCRDWLKKSGHETMPLWLTECGRPWKRGPQRPPADQDATSALDITMKAVEARACGVARYFAFVYPYYDENDNNFGMMDKQATPLRSMAAYAAAARMLAGCEYVGDLDLADRAVQRARLFRRGPAALAVIYTGKPDSQARARLPFALAAAGAKTAKGPGPMEIADALGIDGRKLPLAPDGTVPVPDGLTYVVFNRLDTGHPLVAPHRNTRLWELGRDRPRITPKSSPIVARYQFDPKLVEASSRGYRIKAVPAGKMPVRVRVFNLGTADFAGRIALLPEPGEATGRAGAQTGRAAVLGEAVQSVDVPAGKWADVTWQVDFAHSFGVVPWVAVHTLLEERGGQRARVLVNVREKPLSLRFYGEGALQSTLLRFPRWSRLPIHELNRWTPNVAGIGEMTLAKADDAPWRLSVKFKEGDRWVYPSFELPKDLELQKFAGLLLRVRCHKPGQVRVFLWEGDKGVGYITPEAIAPPDGQWHLAVVRFQDLIPSAANAPDSDGRLDLAQVRRISIGMNSQAAENALDVSDAYVVAERGAK